MARDALERIKKKKQRKKRNRRLFLLFALLGLLVGTGGWNYRRNLAAEQAVPRPYKSYSEAQLAQLIGAYRKDLDGMVARYEKASGLQIDVRKRDFLGEQIAEFERVQRLSQSVRTLGYEISEREATLRELEAEQRLRSDRSLGLRIFLRRCFTFPI